MGMPTPAMGGPNNGSADMMMNDMGMPQPKTRKMAAPAKKNDEDDDNWGNVDALLE